MVCFQRLKKNYHFVNWCYLLELWWEWRTCILTVCFESGLKWWTQVSSQCNLQWKFLRLAWKQVRSVLEMSTLFNLCPDILGTHLVDSLLIPKISLKSVDWTRTNAYELSYLLAVRHLSSKAIWWMASVVEIFGQPDQGSSSVLFLPHLNFIYHFFFTIA